MAEINIPQAEADHLLAMEKHYVEVGQLTFPPAGERILIPLISSDRRESFALDVTRSQIKLTKATYQTRARQVVILLRLDIDGPPHRNPDDEEIPCPHIHFYREGFGDKWAFPAPPERYSDIGDLARTLDSFMEHCNVTLPPMVQRGLFS
ncbi:MAG: hypothetical protein ABI824_17840 [Acidobacteriota bacterium]